MALGKGSGIFNLQFGGEFSRHRKQSLQSEREAQAALNQYYDEAMGWQRPWYDYGQNALSRFQEWEKDPNAITSDPSYKWRLGQGLEALENSAAARGGLLSGNTGKALQDYGQKSASEEYANEFRRWLQRLGIGQGASANMSNLSAGRANALSGLLQKSAENQWRRVMEQTEATRLGELATNSIVQSWVPAQYGGGKPTSQPQGQQYGGDQSQVTETQGPGYSSFYGASGPYGSDGTDYSSLAQAWGGY